MTSSSGESLESRPNLKKVPWARAGQSALNFHFAIPQWHLLSDLKLFNRDHDHLTASMDI